jgi:hypothetical protein
MTDYFLKRCLPDTLPKNVLVTSSNADHIMDRYLGKLSSSDKSAMKSVHNVRNKYAHYGWMEYQVISSLCVAGHFFVVSLTFDINRDQVFKDVQVYDSLYITTESRVSVVQPGSRCAKFLIKLQKFLSAFVFNESPNNQLLMKDQDLILRNASYAPCPHQTNGYDCGLFGMISVLHLVYSVPLKQTSFGQVHISRLRYALSVVMYATPSDSLPDPRTSLSRKFLMGYFPFLQKKASTSREMDPFTFYFLNYNKRNELPSSPVGASPIRAIHISKAVATEATAAATETVGVFTGSGEIPLPEVVQPTEAIKPIDANEAKPKVSKKLNKPNTKINNTTTTVVTRERARLQHTTGVTQTARQQRLLSRIQKFQNSDAITNKTKQKKNGSSVVVKSSQKSHVKDDEGKVQVGDISSIGTVRMGVTNSSKQTLPIANIELDINKKST